MTTTDGRVGLDPIDVRFRAGEAYEIRVREHRLLTDQPADAGGADTAPSPTELFAASLAACVAFYAGRYLSRHGHDRAGLAVTASFEMATDRPARVAAIQITVRPPTDLPPEKWPALRAVASHCTVHNTLLNAPRIEVDIQ
ncbi:OsmC family protein [Verrucosispora sp. WMMA2121]|uniref:OsmC family protein n=1 Tax=Verrucosispora sp. WMMA2121 TaxID=3015164 RepID=UPI0022B72407|nr:OsmC family protein [Verrucosispora sp. WMMA2121]MCZ7422766.1 OsmC family protein [Verrucosispora sp. WMMA2121]